MDLNSIQEKNTHENKAEYSRDCLQNMEVWHGWNGLFSVMTPAPINTCGINLKVLSAAE